MTTDFIIRFSVSLLPVILFLVTLICLDSYKLVPVRGLLLAIFIGAGSALICLTINNVSMRTFDIPRHGFSRYGAPWIEEIAKALYVLWLIRARRVGFMVDAAVIGFALGTGFALIENTYYVQTLRADSVWVWIVRGLGTAIMHGGMTAIGAVVAKFLFDRMDGRGLWFVPGVLLASVLHSVFNHFVLPPVASTVVLHIALPAILLVVFWQSERATRHWLGTQMDVDSELLELIQSGQLSNSRLGGFVKRLEAQFPPAVRVDVVCYLRLHVELAIAAKGLLMMREAGFKPALPEGTREKFQELRHLEKAIGPTGRRVLAPVLQQSTRDLWQMYHIEG